MNKGIILLSGGLDSIVSLELSKVEYNVELALTFDYGQKSAAGEINAASEICRYYNINHEIIKLDWLKNITNSALVSGKKLPEGIQQNSDDVWIPNRNGLFLNIAGCFADSGNYTHIIFGANKEEAQNFSDNTIEFIDSINKEFKYSTKSKPIVIAPLINLNKNDIVSIALKRNVPLELIMSCYANNDKHCGKCESCTRLKNALIANGDTKYIKVLFDENLSD